MEKLKLKAADIAGIIFLHNLYREEISLAFKIARYVDERNVICVDFYKVFPRFTEDDSEEYS